MVAQLNLKVFLTRTIAAVPPRPPFSAAFHKMEPCINRQVLFLLLVFISTSADFCHGFFLYRHHPHNIQQQRCSYQENYAAIANQFSSRLGSKSDNYDDNDNDSRDDGIIQDEASGANWSRFSRRMSTRAGPDTDFMPLRVSDTSTALVDANAQIARSIHDICVRDWGMERHKYPTPHFPNTFDAVAEAAFEAIAATLHGKEKLDPGLASNAMARNTNFDYRPVVANGKKNSGRIGIEIDGAGFLKDDHLDLVSTDDNDNASIQQRYSSRSKSHGGALRRLILVLAGKLSQTPWEGYEKIDNAASGTTKATTMTPRPVAVYFNTVQQALSASQHLQILRSQQQQYHPEEQQLYNNIRILSLGQDDALPSHMLRPAADFRRQRKNAAKKQAKGGDAMETAHGIVIVVQPTDFNQEYLPPGPAMGALASFQKLVARASIEDLPVVMVSPRFSVREDEDPFFPATPGNHQAAAYGGRELPRGPSPWVLRDFKPPIFCWVANALTFTAKERFRLQQKQNALHGHHDEEVFPYSRVALVQSVMSEGHPWHIFAAKEDDQKPSLAEYNYLASTQSGSGRPTRDVMSHILHQ